MPKFAYKLVTPDHEVVSGVTTAWSKGLAANQLSIDGATVLFIAKVRQAKLMNYLSNVSFGFSRMEQILFFRNLASMLGSGVPIIQALEVLKIQVKGGGIKQAMA